MATSIIYRCWPTEFNTARAKDLLDVLERYPLYATTREGLVKVLVEFLSAATDCNEDDEPQMRKEIDERLDVLDKNYEGRHNSLTVNRIAVSVLDPTHFPDRLNLYLEIAQLH